MNIIVSHQYMGLFLKTELTIMCLQRPPKEDKFVVQWAEVPDEEDDPQAPFKAGAQAVK